MGFPGKEGEAIVIEQGSEPEPDMKRSGEKQKGERKPNVIIITVKTLSLYLNHCHPRKPSKTDGSPSYSPEIENFHLLYGPSVSSLLLKLYFIFSQQTVMPSGYTEWMVLEAREYMEIGTIVVH